MSRSKTKRPAAYSVAAAPAVAGFRPAGAALAVAAALGMHPAAGLAQPAGGQAIHGQASFTSTGNNLVVRTQNGAGNFSAINWQSFSIPAGSVTRFVQPTRDSTSINRVVGNDPSAIFGTLRSNGKLVLVNQSGIAVGAGAVVDTAGFTASTLGMSDEDAASGRLRFSGDSAGALTVDGSIVARSGDIVLISPKVTTGEAALVQSNGTTVLAAGRKVEITGRGLEGIHLEVQAGDTAVNLGTLKGDAVGIFAHTLKHSGLVQARAVTDEGGKVVLRATGGDAIVDGTITATAGNRGGSVDVLGERVGLMAGTAIDVSGTQGGGQVRIGGDYQGKNADVPNAKATYVDAAATIRADATAEGDGGRVIVWADDSTRMRGDISARGGERGGDGGFAEVSGKKFLEFAGRVDLRAPKGDAGTLLLDPTNIVISGTDPTQTNIDPDGLDFIFSGGGNLSNIRDTTLAGQLELGNVRVTTTSGSVGTGSITLTADAEVAWGSGKTLALTADTFIQLNGKLTAIEAPPPAPAVAAVGDTNGGLYLQAGSYIQQDASTSVVRVSQVYAQAGTGRISLTGGNLMDRFQGVANTNISVVNAGPLTIAPVTTVYGGGAGNAINAGGNLSITTTSGELRVAPGAGVNAGGNALLQAACDCSDVLIDGTTVNAGGTLRVLAGRDVRIGARAIVSQTYLNGNGGLTISAGQNVVIGNNELGSTTTLYGGNGAINVNATDDITFRSSSNSVYGYGSEQAINFDAGDDIAFSTQTYVTRYNGSIDVLAGGSILGNGRFKTGGRSPSAGTDGGSIKLHAADGSLSFQEIDSQGSFSFSGVSAGDVTLIARGNISGGSILAAGRNSSSTAAAGDGGSVSVTSSRGRIDLSSVEAHGGYVSVGSGGGGMGGSGRKILLSAATGVQAGNLSVEGGRSESSGGTGGRAGDGGDIEVTSTNGDLVLASMNAYGGSSQGTTGAGPGGLGGTVVLSTSGNVSGFDADVSGGSGALGRAAGSISVDAGGSVQLQVLHAKGGFSDSTRNGGSGGGVSVTAKGNITLRSFGDPAVSVDGGSSYQGRGGDAGLITVKSAGGTIVAEQAPASIDGFALIDGPTPGFRANGGYGATGGDGGSIDLEAKIDIRTDGVQAAGGEALNPGGQGGQGGIASVTFGGMLATTYVDASGGKGGDAFGTTGGGTGGRGGTVKVVRSGGNLLLGSGLQLVARGGDGGNGQVEGPPLAGTGGAGGLIDVSSTTGAVVLRAPEIHSQGGMGGMNFDTSTGATGQQGVFTAAGTTVQVIGAMQLHSIWENRSDVRIAGTSSVTGGGAFANFGAVRLDDSAALFPSGGVSNAAGGGIAAHGTDVHLNLVDNHGVLKVAPGATVTTPDFALNEGKVVVDGTLNIGSGVSSGPALLSTSLFTNAAAGEISGTGNLVVAGGAGTVDNFGTISPGGAGAVGTLTLTGNLILESGSTLAVDFASAASHDKLSVSGAATTGGAVAVNLLAGGAVPPGSYTVLQAASLDASGLPSVTPTAFEPVASGSDLLLVVGAAPPAPSVPPTGQNDVVIFAELFVKEATKQENENKGKDDIVITDTACKPS